MTGTTVLAWVLLGLAPDVLDRVRRAAGAAAGASVDDLVVHGGLDLSLLVRTLTPDEWREAMRRLGGRRPLTAPAGCRDRVGS
mgnify:CR=1 FL=1